MLDSGQVVSVLENLNDKDIKRIKKLSASKISLWWHCPMAFFQRYIAHEWVPEHIRLTFGKSIHYFLDQFYKKNYKSPDSFANSWSWYWRGKISGESVREKKTLERMTVKKYPTFRRSPYDARNPTEEEGFLEIGDHITFGNFAEDGNTFLLDSRENPIKHPKVNILFGYTTLGKSILRRFYERHKGREPPIYREKRKTLDIFGHPTIVIFDRVDKWPDGGWTITDYKTNKWPPGGLDLHRNVQFTLYSYAARKMFGNELGPVENAIYHYHLRNGKLYETHRSEEDFVYLEKLLDRTSSEIDRALKTGDFIPYYGYKCPSCDFSVPCETYSIHHGGPKLIREKRIIVPRSFEYWEDLEEANSADLERSE